jgi:HAD superfamily hydrolase (TIGR01490 family)
MGNKSPGKRRVAIFDIDGTIFRSSLLIELTEAMLAAGLFQPDVRRVFLPAYRRWLNRKGPYEDYIGAVVRAFEGNLKGVSEKSVMALAGRVIAGRKDRVYRYTRQLVAELKERGYFLLAISNSPKSILDRFCGYLGFEKVYGRIYEVDGRGRYTGQTLHLDLISDKAKTLRRAVEREGLTLKGSVGVGDTESDIPFLRLVDRPVCFNPNRRLYDRARRSGWKTVVERKDVVYCVWPHGGRP